MQPICLQSPFLPITAVEQDPRETLGERISCSILLASLHHSEASPTPLSEINVSSFTVDFTGRKLEDMVTHLLTPDSLHRKGEGTSKEERLSALKVTVSLCNIREQCAARNDNQLEHR